MKLVAAMIDLLVGQLFVLMEEQIKIEKGK
jgi:hypothetical protein